MIYVKNSGNYNSGKAENAIKEQFLEFLTEKPIDKISVSELCRSMEINRSTFYAYYEDIYHLLDALKNDLLQDMDLCIKRIKMDQSRTARSVTSSVFEFIYNHRVLLKYEFVQTEDKTFLEEINNKVQDLFYTTIFQDHPNFAKIDKDELETALLFLSYGYYAIYKKWLSEDCNVKLTDITDIAIKITENCIEAFDKKAADS